MPTSPLAEQAPLWSALLTAARIARSPGSPAVDQPVGCTAAARRPVTHQSLRDRRTSPFELQAAPTKQRRQHSWGRKDVAAARCHRDPGRQPAGPEPAAAAVKAPAVLAPGAAADAVAAPEAAAAAAAAAEAAAAAAAEALLDEPPTPRRVPVLPQRQWTIEGALSGMIDDAHVAAALLAPPAGARFGRMPSHVPLDIVAEGVEEVHGPMRGEEQAVPPRSGGTNADSLFASGMELMLEQLSPGDASQLAEARLFLSGFAVPLPAVAAGSAAGQCCSWPASSPCVEGWLVPGASLGRGGMRLDDADNLETARSFLSGF
ncbi:hypothetical protein D9Q98_007020 [Chlorella vulgaris]|uniref:Uncharacterized protein n=1 Tax=Chlorella vulgaris TaxID=3077 RepID=A0A9D4TJG3_CHLVU|nr:hypothetical protein D9Q98_007020 [Chlorella vulgaris]